jgi:hypothetical protein
LRNSIRVNQKSKEKKNCYIVKFLCVHFWAASISFGREEVNRAGIELTTEYVIISTGSKRDDVEIKRWKKKKKGKVRQTYFPSVLPFYQVRPSPKKRENQANQFFLFFVLPGKNIIIAFQK